MNLALTPEEEAFRDEVRSWLEANVELPPAFRITRRRSSSGAAHGRRAWRRTAGWASTGPTSTAGAGRRRVQVAIFNMEYARSRAPQPVNRVGINLVGPTLLAHGTDDAEGALAAAASSRPRRSGASSSASPAPGATSPRSRTRAIAGRRRLRGHRARRSGRATPSSPGGACAWRAPTRTRPKHRVSPYLVVDMTAPGVDIRPLVTITGEAEFNEVFLDDVFVPSDCLSADRTRAGPWPAPRWRTSGARPSRSRSRSSTRSISPGCTPRAGRTGTLDDPVVADALAQADVKLGVLRLHNLRTLTRLTHGRGAGSRVERGQAHLDRHDPGPLRRRPARLGQPRRSGATPPATRGRASGTASGCGRKAARSPAGPRRSSATIIGDRILGLPR